MSNSIYIDQSAIKAAIENPAFGSEKAVRKFVEAYDKQDFDTIADKINAGQDLVLKAIRGERLPDNVYKATSSGPIDPNLVWRQKGLGYDGGLRSQFIDIYRSYLNELEYDMEWARAYKQTVAPMANVAEIVDWDAVCTWKEYNQGEKIKVETAGDDNKTRLPAKRYGAGVAIPNFVLESNDYFTLNDAVVSMRTGEMVLKADQAYTDLAVVSASPTVAATNDEDGWAEAINKAPSR